jgi:predicted DNA-binding ribbon-helix-helix protein
MSGDTARSDGEPSASPGAFVRRSTLVSRNVTVAGRRTSIRLEVPMWQALHQLCAREGKSVHQIVTEIDRDRTTSSLTAGIRVHLLTYFQAAATDEGHRLAGHGHGNRSGRYQA